MNGIYAVCACRERNCLSTNPLRVELIDDPKRFDDIREDWNKLLESSPNDSLTVTWEWLSIWWQAFGAARHLRIIAIWDGNTLVGSVPLLARPTAHRYFGTLPFRRIEFLASGEPPGDEVCSDYLNWIAAAGREAQIVDLALDFLNRDLAGEWHEILLPDVRGDSPTLKVMEAACRKRGLLLETLSRESSPYINLPSSWDQYLASVSSSFRYKLRRGRRDFEQLGGKYRVAETQSDIDELFPMLIRLHTARWNARGLPGAFVSKPRNRFHELILPLALKNGWLRLGVLTLPEGPIGAIYSFRYRGRVYFYQSGIAPQESSHLRPGTLLHSYEIESAIGAGYNEYDFLKQGGPDYKDDWANAAHELVCTRICRPGVRNQMLKAARFAHGRLRTLKGRLAAPP